MPGTRARCSGNAAASIRDARAQLTVLVDASQGVASIEDGQLELMLHRRWVHH